MPMQFDSLAALYDAPFDTVIDVRAPAEYAEDHVPGAISLPALTDAERARVGTIYKQVSPFDARKIGAALVAQNVARHLQGPLAGFEGGWRPLIYCWRGGQRSGSVATILSQIGWRTEVIAGGYRSYRRMVTAMLHDTPLPHRLVLLDGNTGTAKTDLLARACKAGAQVIDLEALARHRGSVFGGMAGGQPAQKHFESLLARALVSLDPARPVVIEAESARIGDLSIPPSLWTAMCAAPVIQVTAPLADRARYLAGAYDDIVHDGDRLDAVLQQLIPFHGHKVVDHWRKLAETGQAAALAKALMAQHYDPRYAKSRAAHPRTVLGTVDGGDLEPTALDRAAGSIMRLLGAASL